MPTVRCPMPECRRRVDLDDFEAIPVPPAQPARSPCLHFVAAWGGQRGRMAEAVVHGLTGNRELLIRNLAPHRIDPTRIDEVREALEAIARKFAHVVDTGEGASEEGAPSDAAPAALFADRHEANHVARMYAHQIIGDDPTLGAPRGGL